MPTKYTRSYRQINAKRAVNIWTEVGASVLFLGVIVEVVIFWNIIL